LASCGPRCAATRGCVQRTTRKQEPHDHRSYDRGLCSLLGQRARRHMASFVSPGGCGANQAVVGNVLSVAWLLQVPLFPLTGAFSVYLSARGRTSNIARAALATAGLVLGGAAMIGLAYTTSARLAIVCCALLELDRRSDGPSSNRRRDRPIQPARHCARGVPRLRISRRNTRTADIRKNHRHDGARRYRLSRCLPHLRRFRYRGSSHRARPYAASRRRRTFGRSDQGYDHGGPAVQVCQVSLYSAVVLRVHTE